MASEEWSAITLRLRRAQRIALWAAVCATGSVTLLIGGILAVAGTPSTDAYASTVAVAAILTFFNVHWIIRRILFRRAITPIRSALNETLTFEADSGDLRRLLLSGSTIAGPYRLEAAHSEHKVDVRSTNLDRAEYRQGWYWWSNAAS